MVAFLFAALGLLAKGLIGAVLPALVILAWLAVLRRPRLLLPLLWLPGFALFLAVAAPWFLAMQWRFPEFADYFFVVQHFKRFAASGFNNVQPFWYLPAVLALLTLPWFAWLPLAVRRSYWNDPQQGPVRQLMWIWIAVLTLFFSLPQSKLVGYILPVTFPLAYLVGDSAAVLLAASARARLLWRITAAVAVTICVTAVVLGALYDDKSLRDLGRTLARQAAPQDGVVFLNDYYFDLPFYAGLRAPVLVLDDWDDPEAHAARQLAQGIVRRAALQPALGAAGAGGAFGPAASALRPVGDLGGGPYRQRAALSRTGPRGRGRSGRQDTALACRGPRAGRQCCGLPRNAQRELTR